MCIVPCEKCSGSERASERLPLLLLEPTPPWPPPPPLPQPLSLIMGPPRGRGRGKSSSARGGARGNTHAGRAPRDTSTYAGAGYSDIPASAVDQTGSGSDSEGSGASLLPLYSPSRRADAEESLPADEAADELLASMVPVAMWVGVQLSPSVCTSADARAPGRTLTTATRASARARSSRG